MKLMTLVGNVRVSRRFLQFLVAKGITMLCYIPTRVEKVRSFEVVNRYELASLPMSAHTVEDKTFLFNRIHVHELSGQDGVLFPTVIDSETPGFYPGGGIQSPFTTQVVGPSNTFPVAQAQFLQLDENGVFQPKTFTFSSSASYPDGIRPVADSGGNPPAAYLINFSGDGLIAVITFRSGASYGGRLHDDYGFYKVYRRTSLDSTNFSFVQHLSLPNAASMFYTYTQGATTRYRYPAPGNVAVNYDGSRIAFDWSQVWGNQHYDFEAISTGSTYAIVSSAYTNETHQGHRFHGDYHFNIHSWRIRRLVPNGATFIGWIELPAHLVVPDVLLSVTSDASPLSDRGPVIFCYDKPENDFRIHVFQLLPTEGRHIQQLNVSDFSDSPDTKIQEMTSGWLGGTRFFVAVRLLNIVTEEESFVANVYRIQYDL